MLQELLLSLSGYPSPLFEVGTDAAADAATTDVLSRPVASLLTVTERALLAPLGRLADLNARLQMHTSHLASSHASAICRAVASAVATGPLAEFQQHIIDTERLLLRRDASFVADGNTVPLTAVVGEFTPWTRRMEWLWHVVVGGFILGRSKAATAAERRKKCTGAGLVNLLRGEMVSGYADIEMLARTLAAVAETAWLKQVSAWILYGRLPSFGADDFFVHEAQGDDGGFVCESSLLPCFVTPDTASSMLFVGKSLAHIRLNRMLSASATGLQSSTHIAQQLRILSELSFPLEPAAFSRAIAAVRLSLSRNTLQKLLPLTKVVEALELLRSFMLLKRGEFAVALVQEADERMRSRWKGCDDSAAAAAYRRIDGFSATVVKEGEVVSILAKTWAALAALQGRHAEEDEGLELARSLLQLELLKTKPQAPLTLQTHATQAPITIVTTPFRNLLLSVPVSLTLDIPSPLDMFLSPSDLAVYSAINAYLLAIRRAHIHLTNLWKITSLRRHHPAPPGPPRGSTRTGRAHVMLLRKRETNRTALMRGPWVTCSAAVFLLAETEAYLQADVVSGMWDGFHAWLMGRQESTDTLTVPNTPTSSSHEFQSKTTPRPTDDTENGNSNLQRIQDSSSSEAKPPTPPPHDPQTLTVAHQTYLAALAHHLVLTCPSFTDPLYSLLAHIDHLVALVHRLHAIWSAVDLGIGAVDDAYAHVDLERDEGDVITALDAVQVKVRKGVEDVVASLRALVATDAIKAWADMGSADDGREGGGGGLLDGDDGLGFVPPRIGGLERLLMKLDFGAWFGKDSSGGYEFDGF